MLQSCDKTRTFKIIKAVELNNSVIKKTVEGNNRMMLLFF